MKNIFIICVAHEIPTFRDTDKARGDVTFAQGQMLKANPHPALNKFNPVTRELYWCTGFTEIFDRDVNSPMYMETNFANQNFLKDQLSFQNTLNHVRTIEIQPKHIGNEMVKMTVYLLAPKKDPQTGDNFELEETRVLFDHDWNTLPQIRESLGEAVKILNLSKDTQKNAKANPKILDVLQRIEYLESVESEIVALLQPRDRDLKISTQHYKPTAEEEINKLFSEMSLDDSSNSSTPMQVVMTPKLAALCTNVALGFCDTDEAEELEKTMFFLRTLKPNVVVNYNNNNNNLVIERLQAYAAATPNKANKSKLNNK